MTGKLRCFAALIALASPTLSVAAETLPGPYHIDLAHVERIDCGRKLGTGVRIDGNTVITAFHVVSNMPVCKIRGEEVEIVHIADGLDFAVLRTKTPFETRALIRCTEPSRDEQYTAIGYAEGRMAPVISRVRFTGYRTTMKEWPDMLVFKGDPTIGGMSGGPVFNEQGEVVAIVNAGDAKSRLLSRSLLQTYLCAK